MDIRAITDIVGTMRANIELGREHYAELVALKHVVEFDPHLDRYAMLEANNCMVNLGAYDGDKLVGYSTNVLGPHMDSQHLMCAHNTMFFLSKQYRKGLQGIRLLRATTAACKERGARYMLWRAKPDTSMHALLARMGHLHLETVYSEVIT